MLPEQWCCPFLRQQIGTPASASLMEAKRGDTKGKPNNSSNRMETSPRNTLIGT